MASFFMFGILVLLSLASFSESHVPVQLNQLSVRQETCDLNDICFAIDVSGSISQSRLNLAKNFVEDIAIEIDSKTSEETRYSAVAFSSSAKTIQKSTTNLAEFVEGLNNIKAVAQSTAIGRGLLRCRRLLRRKAENRVVIVISDGRDNGEPPAKKVSQFIKRSNITIITVGVGEKTKKAFLRGLASVPEYFLPSEDFKKLSGMVLDVALRSCAGQPSPSPSSVPDPCAEAFQECDLRFSGNKKLRTFALPDADEEPFTSRVVSKAGSAPLPELESLDPTVSFILDDGTRTLIQDISTAVPSFAADQLKATKKLKFRLFSAPLSGNQRSQMSGRCLLVNFKFKGGLTNRCTVFKTA